MKSRRIRYGFEFEDIVGYRSMTRIRSVVALRHLDETFTGIIHFDGDISMDGCDAGSESVSPTFRV